jgi:hypothetical protein
VKILSLLESDGPVTPKFRIDGLADRVSTNLSAQLGVTMTVSSLTCQVGEERRGGEGNGDNRIEDSPR